MSRQSILNNRLKNHLTFFRNPLPKNETVFDLQYSSATMDWRPLRREIDKYNLSLETVRKLDHLFELAESFLYSLKGSPQAYQVATLSLGPRWQAIRNLAVTIRVDT